MLNDQVANFRLSGIPRSEHSGQSTLARAQRKRSLKTQASNAAMGHASNAAMRMTHGMNEGRGARDRRDVPIFPEDKLRNKISVNVPLSRFRRFLGQQVILEAVLAAYWNNFTG